MAPNCHRSPKTQTRAKKKKRQKKKKEKITLPQGAKAHGLKGCGDGSVSGPRTSRHGCRGWWELWVPSLEPAAAQPGVGEAVANLCSQQSRWIPARLRKDMCQTQPPAALLGRRGGAEICAWREAKRTQTEHAGRADGVWYFGVILIKNSS